MSRICRIGIVVLALISLGDLAAPLLTDGEHPPMVIALINCAAGLVSIGLAVLAWRTGKIGFLIGLIVVRVLSALTAVPAFQVPGVPLPAMVLAGTYIGLTVVGVGLSLAGLRRPALVQA